MAHATDVQVEHPEATASNGGTTRSGGGGGDGELAVRLRAMASEGGPNAVGRYVNGLAPAQRDAAVAVMHTTFGNTYTGLALTGEVPAAPAAESNADFLAATQARLRAERAWQDDFNARQGAALASAPAAPAAAATQAAAPTAAPAVEATAAPAAAPAPSADLSKEEERELVHTMDALMDVIDGLDPASADDMVRLQQESRVIEQWEARLPADGSSRGHRMIRNMQRIRTSWIAKAEKAQQARSTPAAAKAPAAPAEAPPTEAHLQHVMDHEMKGVYAAEGKEYGNSYLALKAECQKFRADIMAGEFADLIDFENVNEEVLIELQAHLRGVSPKDLIADAEMAAIRGYTSGDYKHLNAVLRNPAANPQLAAKLRPYIQLTVSGLAKLPDFIGSVFRGAKLKPEAAESYTPGKVVEEAGFMSSSYQQQQAEVFRDQIDPTKLGHVPTLFEIQSKHGKRVEFLSYKAREAEVLFAPGTQLRVIDAYYEGSNLHVSMVEV